MGPTIMSIHKTHGSRKSDASTDEKRWGAVEREKKGGKQILSNPNFKWNPVVRHQGAPIIRGGVFQERWLR